MSTTMSQYKPAVAETPSPRPSVAEGEDSAIPQPFSFSKDTLAPPPRSSSGESTLTGSTPPKPTESIHRRRSCPGAVLTGATEADATIDNESPRLSTALGEDVVNSGPSSFSKDTLVPTPRSSSGETTLTGSTPPIPPKSICRRRSCPGAVVITRATAALKGLCQAEPGAEERQPNKTQPTIDPALGSFVKNELGSRFSESLSALEEQEGPCSARDSAPATDPATTTNSTPAPDRATTPPQHIVWADRATPEQLPLRPRSDRSGTSPPRSRSPSPVPKKRHRAARLRGLLCM